MIAGRWFAACTVGVVVTMGTADAKTIHQRQAVTQTLEWRAPFSLDRTGRLKDPVEQIVFSCYNDQLFRLVIDYDRQRTERLTDADMVEAISAVYGAPLPPPLKARGTLSQPVVELGTRVAGWGDGASSAVLYRSWASGFRMVVTSSPLEALARKADIQAIALDEREAPQQEIDKQKQEAAEAQAGQGKARLTNKAGFRP
jgi:hypothetical protein